MKNYFYLASLALVPTVLAAVSVITLAQMTTPQPPLKTTPTEMVDTLNSVFGPYKERAIHAKGIMSEGTFTASALNQPETIFLLRAGSLRRLALHSN